MIDSSPVALVEFALDTHIRLWNRAAERIFGWSQEEMLGRAGLPMAPPSRRAESQELFARVRAGESVSDHETVRLRKDGTLVDGFTAAFFAGVIIAGLGIVAALTLIRRDELEQAPVAEPEPAFDLAA